MNGVLSSSSGSASGEHRTVDICGLFALALLVYALVLVGNRVIPNIDHVTHYRWLTQFYAAIQSGVWYPRWMAMAQLGLGEAHYSAYPLYYYTASIFLAAGLGPWTAMKAMAVLSTFLGAVTIYLALNGRLGRKAALLGAFFWLIAPFPFFLVTNYGALPWHFSLFLALQFILISLLPAPRFGRFKIAVVAMALIFAHVLVAFMTFASMGLTLACLAARDADRRARIVKFWAMPTLVGVLLTAFHFLPTLAVQSLLRASPENASTYLNWRNSFMFPSFSFLLWGGRWFSLQWVYPGLALIGAITSSLVLWRCRGARDGPWNLLLSLTMFAVAGLALGSEFAFPLYFLDTPFRSLQWPYRFVTIGALGAALALPIAVLLCQRAGEKAFVAKTAAAAAMLVTLAVFGALQLQLLREGRDPQLTPLLLTGEFHQDGNQFATTGPKWREYVQSGGIGGQCQRVRATCIEGSSNTQRRVWEIEAGEPLNLVFPLFAFPAWTVRIDGNVMTSSIDPESGLIALAIPPGKRKVEIELAELPQSRAGLAVSLIGLLGLLLLVAIDFRPVRKPTSSPV